MFSANTLSAQQSLSPPQVRHVTYQPNTNTSSSKITLLALAAISLATVAIASVFVSALTGAIVIAVPLAVKAAVATVACASFIASSVAFAIFAIKHLNSTPNLQAQTHSHVSPSPTQVTPSPSPHIPITLSSENPSSSSSSLSPLNPNSSSFVTSDLNSANPLTSSSSPSSVILEPSPPLIDSSNSSSSSMPGLEPNPLYIGSSTSSSCSEFSTTPDEAVTSSPAGSEATSASSEGEPLDSLRQAALTVLDPNFTTESEEAEDLDSCDGRSRSSLSSAFEEPSVEREEAFIPAQRADDENSSAEESTLGTDMEALFTSSLKEPAPSSASSHSSEESFYGSISSHSSSPISSLHGSIIKRETSSLAKSLAPQTRPAAEEFFAELFKAPTPGKTSEESLEDSGSASKEELSESEYSEGTSDLSSDGQEGSLESKTDKEEKNTLKANSQKNSLFTSNESLQKPSSHNFNLTTSLAQSWTPVPNNINPLTDSILSDRWVGSEPFLENVLRPKSPVQAAMQVGKEYIFKAGDYVNMPPHAWEDKKFSLALDELFLGAIDRMGSIADDIELLNCGAEFPQKVYAIYKQLEARDCESNATETYYSLLFAMRDAIKFYNDTIAKNADLISERRIIKAKTVLDSLCVARYMDVHLYSFQKQLITEVIKAGVKEDATLASALDFKLTREDFLAIEKASEYGRGRHLPIQGNVPCVLGKTQLFSFNESKLSKGNLQIFTVNFLSIGVPVQEEDSKEIDPIFKSAMQAHCKASSHLYVSFQGGQSGCNTGLKALQEELSVKNPEDKASGCFHFAVLPQDSNFYYQKGEDFSEGKDMSAASFREKLLNQLFGRDTEFYFPDAWLADSLFNEGVEKVIDFVDKLFFNSKETLSYSERKNFIDIFYAALFIFMVRYAKANTANATRQSDIAIETQCLVLRLLMLGHHQSEDEEQQQYLKIFAHAPAFMLNEQMAIESSERQKRLMDSLEILEAADVEEVEKFFLDKKEDQESSGKEKESQNLFDKVNIFGIFPNGFFDVDKREGQEFEVA